MSATELAIQATASGVSRIYEDGQQAFGKAFELLNTQLLPMLGKGVTISADYFHDLAGRYVTYLVVTDSLQFILPLLPLFAVPYLYGWSKRAEKESKSYTANENHVGRTVILGIVCVMLVGVSLDGLFDLVKDLTIPELRVYEELSALYKSSKF